VRVSLIIPALNEADSLPSVLREVPSGVVKQIIVVDNGSSDRTAEVARMAGAQVVDEPRRGYGFACAAGSAAADGEALVFMDGDGSFMPAELTALLRPALEYGADLVLGSRLSGQADHMPAHQRLGNLLFVWLLRWRFGLRLTDLGPFRLIRRDVLAALEMRERTHGWPLEMIIKAAQRGKRIVEVPVTYRPRRAGVSKVGGTIGGSILAAVRFFLVAVRYAF
jgi:glycosyltransferase involved in cell wall biosynthesis